MEAYAKAKQLIVYRTILFGALIALIAMIALGALIVFMFLTP